MIEATMATDKTPTLAERIDALIAREGGYSNDPHDAGGETMYGVTVHEARAFGYTGPMRDMPRAVAVRIYVDRYWNQPRLPDVAALAPAVADELFDTGVNMGVGTAGRFLQRALNVLNQGGRQWPDLTVDGLVGNLTIYALKQYLAVRGKDGEAVLLRMLNAQQSVRYIELAEATPTNEDFEFGWQKNRVGG